MVASLYRSRPSRAGAERLIAGLLLAAAASELIPDMARGDRANRVALGFALGLGVMLLVSRIPGRIRLKAPRGARAAAGCNRRSAGGPTAPGQLPTRDRSTARLAEVFLLMSAGPLLYLAIGEILVDAQVQPDAWFTAAAASAAFILLLLTRTLRQRD